jgi:PAS domain S-box-containing protein
MDTSMRDSLKDFIGHIRRRGLFYRTFMIMMTLSVILITLFAVLMIPREKAAILSAMESQAKNITASISEATASSLLNGDYGSVVEHHMHVLGRSRDIYYIITIRANGFSILSTPDKWETKDQPDTAWQGRELSKKSGIINSSIAGKEVYHYGTPLQLSGFDWGYIYIGISISNYNEQIKQTYIVIFFLSLLCLITAAVLSFLFARRLTEPIRSLRQTAYRIMQGDPTARATIPPDDEEVGELAQSFNKMTDQMVSSQKKIQDAYDELEQYRENLERLVLQRTKELTATNQQLQSELAERRRAENALAESEQRYRVIFETAGNANMIAEEDHTISMINTAFERLSGFSKHDVEGKKKWEDFFAAEDYRKIQRQQARRPRPIQSDLGEYEASFIDREGNARLVYLAIAEIPGTGRVIISLVDMTEIKKLEAQLLQAQKMEAIGQLAGGVAHDFNNILTAIIGFASLLKMNIKKDQALLTYVDPILTSAEKAAQLTQGLLAFSRKQIIEPKHVDINVIILKLEHLLVRLLGEDVELGISCASGAVTIFADAGQMEQILINLATNARDAMPDGGFLAISTDTTTITQEHFTDDAKYEIKPGKYAVITVSDTGAGMSRETIAHIFEPFYTTKEVGKGTGLGLSIVYGVIKQHNGHVTVYSEPGAGTTFKIYFPLVKAMAEEESTELLQPERGYETILVAEDDDVTRELSRLVLEKFGYSVIEATDGEHAVEIFTKHHAHIDLVLLDVIMPKLNGKAAYDAMQQIKPKMRALFISGYTADIIHRKGIFESNINFISKPVTPEVLARKIREVLDAD